MADKRAFAKFDVGYLDNPKMADVLDRSLHAICMHFASVLHCSQHLTDGLVAPRAMQRKAGGSEADIQILLDAGLWHGPDHDCEPCWEACPTIPENRVYVHDFLEHNRDAAQAKRVSEKRSKVAKEGWEKRRAEANGDANSNANSMQNAMQKNDVCNAEREREKEREEEAKASSPEIPRPDIDGVIQGFSELLKANDVKHKPSQSWRTATRLLIDKDGYTPDQILYVARFATTDEFWKSNVLSMPKLREKFEALKIKAQGQGQQSRPTASQVRLQAGLELLQRTAARAQPQQPTPYQTEIEG